MSIGARLYSLRVYNKFSTEELADKLGVAKNTVYRWERNFFAPTKPKLLRLAELYGVSVDWILKGVESEDSDLERKFSIPNSDAPHVIKNVDIIKNKIPSNMSEAGRDEDCAGGEYILMAMYKKLPCNKKNHLLGYLERMYVEVISNERSME